MNTDRSQPAFRGVTSSAKETPPADPALVERKAVLRRQLRALLSGMPAVEREGESSSIREVIGSQSVWRHARCILGFVPLPSEPDLWALFQERVRAGGLCCVPRWNVVEQDYEAARLPSEGGLSPGPYGVLEPDESLPVMPWERLDLILVPGLGFDRRGWRLGRGRGHFDRLLRRVIQTSRWGIAFDRQIVEQVPIEPHDVNVNFLVTPRLGLMATEP